MPFLFQRDVPLIITILVAAWTWLISDNIRQTNDLQIIEYQYNYKNDGTQIFVHNISQAKSVQNLKMLISCVSGHSCFELNGEFAGTTKFVPPFGVVPTQPGTGERAGDSNRSNRAYFTFSLTVDAAIVLVLYVKAPEQIHFAVVNSEQFEKLKILDATSWTAWFYRNYWSIIITFLIVASVIVAGLVFLFGKKLEPANEVPSNHNVTLTIETKK